MRRRNEDARGCWSNYNETLRKVYKKNNEAARLETENQELGHQHKALKVQCSAQLEDKDLLVRELIKHLKLSVKIKEKHRLTKTHYLKHKAKMQQHRSQSPDKKHRSSSRNAGIPLKEKGLLTQRTHYPKNKIEKHEIWLRKTSTKSEEILCNETIILRLKKHIVQEKTIHRQLMSRQQKN